MIVDWANLRTINLHKNQLSKKILKDSIELTPLTSLKRLSGTRGSVTQVDYYDTGIYLEIYSFRYLTTR